MENYSLAADLLATFRASPDIIKALCLILPPAFVLSILTLFLRWKEGKARRDNVVDMTALLSHDKAILLWRAEEQSLLVPVRDPIALLTADASPKTGDIPHR